MTTPRYVESPTDLVDRQSSKLTGWAKEPSLRELKRDLEQARPYQQEQVRKIQRWRDHLNITGSAKIKVQDGRSSVQPRLIRKQAEWRYSSLSEPFLSAEKIFTVDPTSWEDRDAADQNEVLLNWQFHTKINLVKFIDDFTHTAVDEGAVAVRVGWERKTRMETVMAPVYSYFPVESEKQLAQLEQAIQLSEENPAEFEALDPALQESARYSKERNIPAIAIMSGQQEVQQETVLVNKPTVEVIEIANLYVDVTCNGDIDKAMFVAYVHEVTRGDLMQDGRYTNLDSVNWGQSPLSEPDYETNTPAEVSFEAMARQKVVMTEMYAMYDIDDTGELKPILICWIGNTIVRMEENPFPDDKPPFVIVPYMPVKKSIYGEPDGELLIDNQKILGAVTRGIIDTLARSANGQRGMAKGMLDVTNRRRYEKGQDYDFNPNLHPKNAIVEHTYPEIPASAMNMVSMQAMEAESLTGVKTFDDGLNSGSLGKVAAGIRGALDAANRREMAILRRLAQGMAEIGNKILAMNQEFLSNEEVVRVTNRKFITVRRDNLAGRFDMKVVISTAGEDEAKASRLEFMLQTLGNNASPEMTQMILEQIATLRRMPDLAHQIRNYQPQPDPLAVRKAELEIAELEAKVEKAKAEAQESMARAQLALAKANETQSNADLVDLNFVEQESGTQHLRDMDKLGAQAQANLAREIVKGELNLEGKRNNA